MTHMARTSRRKGAPTFQEALQDMRDAARSGVQSAIDQAVVLQPPRRARGRPRHAGGHQAQALFQGVIDGIAGAVIESAKPGTEHVMAQLVADMLIATVHKQLCASRA